ncbi:hypothetical protein AB1Y20_020958 [Prymnesium parvum]|uniref:Uncharacterized protein n=1 Tax=Prymnesium parvum TaxID=97485 RepID=A0AB34JKX5_PRYPA
MAAAANREKYWHDHVAREHYKSTLNRQKLLSSSSSSSSLSKLKLGPHDIKSCSLNYSASPTSTSRAGWPQSSVHTSSSTQQKLWEETISFGRS